VGGAVLSLHPVSVRGILAAAVVIPPRCSAWETAPGIEARSEVVSVADTPLFVILAAGKNSRFWPLRGKSLLSFCGRTLIERQIDTLAALGVTEGTVVTNADSESEMRAVTARYGDRVTITVPETALGMGHAVLAAADALGERLGNRPLLVTQSHDVVEPELYARVLAAGEDAGVVVAQEVDDYFPGGYLALNGDRIMGVVEKPPPGSEPSRYVTIVIHLHPEPRRLLEALRGVYESENTRDDHYERALTVLCGEVRYRMVPYDGPWHPIKYPWQVLGAMRYFLDRLEPPPGPQPQGVRGTVVLEPGVVVMPGALVNGPAYVGAGTVIGNETLVRGSMLGRNCEVGFGCEVARSYIGDGCTLHHNYVGDSVLEGRVGLGFGTVTGNWPFYPPPVRTTVGGERVRTEMERLGAIVGAGSRTGIGVLLNPGIKIGRGSYIGPGVVLARDVGERQMLLVKQELIERDNPFVDPE